MERLKMTQRFSSVLKVLLMLVCPFVMNIEGASSEGAENEARYLELREILRLGRSGSINTDSKGELLGNPDLERRCWMEIERNALAARRIPELAVEIAIIDKKLQLLKGPPGQPDHPDWIKHKELEKKRPEVRELLDEAKRSRERLKRILSDLNRLNDVRTVRLIGPILGEEHRPGNPLEDFRVESVPVFASMILRGMANAGVLKLPQPPNSLGLKEWRTWWQEHREDYGVIYELPKAHPELPPEAEARNVLATSKPSAQSTPTERVKQKDANEPPTGMSANWYWVVSAVSVVLVVGVFAAFRKKA